MMNKPKIYLAGGFKSGWQNSISKALPDCMLFDPSQHKIDDPKAYTEWDLKAIERSDALFAYIEKTNPGGYALAMEIGYAKALGKFIIFVEEHDTPTRHKYFEMIRQVSDVNFRTLTEAVEYLKNWIKTKSPKNLPP